MTRALLLKAAQLQVNTRSVLRDGFYYLRAMRMPAGEQSSVDVDHALI